jgi:hypothetical protein
VEQLDHDRPALVGHVAGQLDDHSEELR